MSILPYLGDHLGDALLDLSLVGHVHGDGEGVAMLGLDLLGRLARRIEIEIGDDGRAAFSRKADGDLLAYAAGGTGDDCNSSFETGHATGPWLCAGVRVTNDS